MTGAGEPVEKPWVGARPTIVSGFPWTASYIKSGVQDLTSENWSAGELEMWSYEVVHGLAWAWLRRTVGPWVLEDGSYTADVVLGAVPGFPAMVTRPLLGARPEPSHAPHTRFADHSCPSEPLACQEGIGASLA